MRKSQNGQAAKILKLIRTSPSLPHLSFQTPSWESNSKLSWKFALCFDSWVPSSLNVSTPSTTSPLGPYKNACCVLSSLSAIRVQKSWEWGKDHLPHRTGQHLFCALHSSHFTQRTSAPPGNRLCHHNSVVTSAYTMKALGISNSLDSFKSWPVRSCPVLALFGGFLKVLFPTFIRMQLIGNGFCINFQTAMFLSWHIRFSQHSFEVRCHYASIKGKDNSIWGSLTSHN